MHYRPWLVAILTLAVHAFLVGSAPVVPALLLAAFLEAGLPSDGWAAGPDKYVPTPEQLRRAGQRGRARGGRVYKDRIIPHWLAGNTRFWYRNDLPGGTKEFILVDAEAGTRQAAFDHKKLAAALSRAAGQDYHADRLPFDQIELRDRPRAVRFSVGDTTWSCDLSTYECSRSPGDGPVQGRAPAADDAEQPGADASLSLDDPAPDGEQREARQRPPAAPERSARSPDKKWTAFTREANVWLRDKGGKETRLTTDGTTAIGYGRPQWSPDSKALVAFRIDPKERKEVYLIESSPRGGGRARLHSRPYALPGDKLTSFELHLFDPAAGKEVPCPVDKIDFGFPRLRWGHDGHTFTYEKVDRGHQRFRLVEVDAVTGKARNLIDETTRTFIWTAHTENVGVPLVTYLSKSDEIIYVSERDWPTPSSRPARISTSSWCRAWATPTAAPTACAA